MGILVFTGIHIIILICTVSSVEICSNDTQIGEVTRFSKSYGSGVSCGCSVNVVDGDSNVTVLSDQDAKGCQYKLMLSFKTETMEYNCKNRSASYQFTMTPTDLLYIILVNGRNDTSGFVINFSIQTKTNGSLVNLTCSNPWTIPLTTPQTSSPGPTGASLTNSMVTPTTVGDNNLHYDSTTGASSTNSMETLTTVGDSNLHYDSTTGASGQTESTETTDTSKITEEPQTPDLPVIVGCTVGGLVLIFVIIVICFLKRRKQKH